MKTQRVSRVWWSVTLVVLLVVAWLAFRSLTGEDVAPPAVVGPRVESPGSTGALVGSAASDERARLPELVAQPADAVTRETGANADVAVVRGRFLNAGGSALEGVFVQLKARSSERASRPFERVVRSDARGRFECSFTPAEVTTAIVQAGLGGFGPRSWDLGVLEAGEVADLGDVTLLAGGVVVGTLVDGAGVPLAVEGWRVAAHAKLGGPALQAGVDGATGTFRLVGLAAGWVRVQASGPGGVSSSVQELLVEPGGEHAVQLVHGAASGAGSILVRAQFAGLSRLRARGEHVQLIGTGGELSARPTDLNPLSGLPYHFGGLAEGSYTVRVDDPRFEAVEREGVRVGEMVNLALVGSAALELDVLDEQGVPVADFDVVARIDDGTQLPPSFAVQLDEAWIGIGPRLFSGLPALDLTLEIAPRGHAPLDHDLAPLAPGERRSVIVRLPAATTIEGVVRDETGAPLPRARVRLSRPALVLDSDDSRVLPLTASRGLVGPLFRLAVQEAETTLDGTFHFRGFYDGEYVVRAELRPAASRGLALKLAPRTPRVEVDLTLPRCGFLAGRLVGLPAGAERDPIVVDARALRLVGSLVNEHGRGDTEFDVKPDAEGRFLLELPPGVWEPGITRLLDSSVGGPRRSRLHSFDEVTIESGRTTSAEWVVSALWCGTLRVYAKGPTELLGAYVSVVGPTGPLERLDADGFALLQGVAPGAVELVVRAHDGAWSCRIPGRFDVVPGETTSAHVLVELGSGELTLVDASSGELLRDVGLFLLPEGSQRAARRRTDAEGRLALTLAPGRYSVGLSTSGDSSLRPEDSRLASFAALQWSLAGPSVSTLALGAQPESR